MHYHKMYSRDQAACGGMARGMEAAKPSPAWSVFVGSLPLPLFGLALGIAGLGNLLAPISPALHELCGLASAALWLLMALRCAMFPRKTAEELRAAPATAGAFAGCFMSALLLTGYVREWAFGFGQILWFALTALYGLYALWFSFVHIRASKFSQWYPSCFLPYAGLAIVSISAPPAAPQLLLAAFLWAGTISYFVLIPLLALRHVRFGTPDHFRPLNCMFGGPAGVLVAGFATVYATSLPPAALVSLAVVAQVLMLAVLVRLPSFLRVPFAPSYAAFTFPFLIAAVGFGKGLAWLKVQGFALPGALEGLLVAEEVLAVSLTCYVMVRFVAFLAGLWKKAAR